VNKRGFRLGVVVFRSGSKRLRLRLVVLRSWGRIVMPALAALLVEVYRSIVVGEL